MERSSRLSWAKTQSRHRNEKKKKKKKRVEMDTDEFIRQAAEVEEQE